MTSKFPPHGRGVRPLRCRECGIKRDDGNSISARGLCGPCAHERMRVQAEAQRDCDPEYMAEWGKQYARGVLDYMRTLTPQ